MTTTQRGPLTTAVALVLLWVLVGCAGGPASERPGTPNHSSGASSATSERPQASEPLPVAAATPNSCHARRVGPEPDAFLPDPNCTPGATRSAPLSEICPLAKTKTVRPPASYTGALKRQQMVAYGFTDSPSAHEEDHLVPLELLGAPSDPKNLWPQPQAKQPNDKDGLENYLHAQVCASRISLTEAQHEIAVDWYSAWVQAGRPRNQGG